MRCGGALFRALEFYKTCSAIKFQNFKAGRAKPSERKILEASLNEILKTRFSEIFKTSPGANFKSGAAMSKF